MAVKLDYAGLQITATRADGTTEDVTALCTFDPPDGTEVTTPGRILVKATYTENAGTDNEQTFDTYFEIGVGAIVRLDVTQTPDKMTYYVGEFIDLTGMVVTAFLSDGSEVDVTADCTTIPPDGTEVLTEGHIIVDVLYKDGQGAGQFEMTATVREIIDSGDWWTLWSDGELEIFCEGNMPNYGWVSNTPWYSHREDVLSVTIKSGVTSIGNSSFETFANLVSVTIPDSVTYINGYAFSDCSNLTSVIIPDSVISIGARAFQRCASLTNVTIPASVRSIGHQAFYHCSSLTEIIVDSNNSAYSSIDGVLLDKGQTTIIQYPEEKQGTAYSVPNGVTTIYDYAFFDCQNLTSIELPDSVTAIGAYTFSNCVGLTSVTIPNSVASMGNFVFSSCASLTSVTIPNSLTRIASSAFQSCASLQNITIPDSVTSIGTWAFIGCDSLTDIYYTGTQEQWRQIELDANAIPSYPNSPTIHYNSTGPT